MENPVGVSVVKRVGNLRAQIEHRLRRQPLRRNPLAQRFAWNVFHGDIGLAIDFTDLVNRANVRMIEGGSGTGFAKNSRASFLIGEGSHRRQLERDVAVEFLVVGTKDHAHTARASLLQDDVVCEYLADHIEKAPMSGIIGWSPESRQTSYANDPERSKGSASRLKPELGLPENCVEVREHFRRIPLLKADEFARDLAVAIDDVQSEEHRGAVGLSDRRMIVLGSRVAVGRKDHALILQKSLISSGVLVGSNAQDHAVARGDVFLQPIQPG